MKRSKEVIKERLQQGLPKIAAPNLPVLMQLDTKMHRSSDTKEIHCSGFNQPYSKQICIVTVCFWNLRGQRTFNYHQKFQYFLDVKKMLVRDFGKIWNFKEILKKVTHEYSRISIRIMHPCLKSKLHCKRRNTQIWSTAGSEHESIR